MAAKSMWRLPRLPWDDPDDETYEPRFNPVTNVFNYPWFCKNEMGGTDMEWVTAEVWMYRHNQREQGREQCPSMRSRSPRSSSHRSPSPDEPRSEELQPSEPQPSETLPPWDVECIVVPPPGAGR